jgi:hypothetical protein
MEKLLKRIEKIEKLLAVTKREVLKTQQEKQTMQDIRVPKKPPKENFGERAARASLLKEILGVIRKKEQWNTSELYNEVIKL